MAQLTGKVIQVIGPVVDVEFDIQVPELPNIDDALEILASNDNKVVIECQQHIGEHTIRCIAMDSTDGLQRGMTVVSRGMPITMPLGESVKGPLVKCCRTGH
jgi:F-type H+/Na+-transporting ATPase subunit beta